MGKTILCPHSRSKSLAHFSHIQSTFTRAYVGPFVGLNLRFFVLLTFQNKMVLVDEYHFKILYKNVR